MFLQETKTKRAGKTYISYLVRESFRTANGPRGRTICNLTHLPKEVRDIVARALKGESLVPVNSLEVNNIHSVGGCVVLEDAAKRHAFPALLAPLSPRNGSLVQAMIFGGLLFPPSVAPFPVESRTVRLAMFCGLDPDRERFDPADLTAALKELDERWQQNCGLLNLPPRTEARAVTFFRPSQSSDGAEMGVLGMDAEGIPVLLAPKVKAAEAGLRGFLRQLPRQPKGGPPLLILDEETATRLNVGRLESQPYLADLGPESLADLLRQLNHAQLLDAFREGVPVEVRHHGERYILAPLGEPQKAETQESPVRMGRLNELTVMTAGRSAGAAISGRIEYGGTPGTGGFHAVMTNVPAERLSAATALVWANRGRMARTALSPVQIVPSQPAVNAWRNHLNLQFLTHRMRCHLQAEWSSRGETRPVEEVLRDLQEVHRATLTVDGVMVRRLATHPSKAVAALLAKLNLWELFESVEPGKQ